MSLIRRLKGVILKKVFKSAYRPGTYYSTIPDLQDIGARSSQIFASRAPGDIGEVTIDRDRIGSFLEECAYIYKEFNFPESPKAGSRYYTHNIFFNKADAMALFIMMRRFRPKRIIEVGSGYSSALMLDIRDQWFANDPLSLQFIEPYPERLNSLLTEKDRQTSTVTQRIVQQVALDVFRQLKENDILFIDSSHVSKIGSDLNYLLFEVLPVLQPGVIIHFHDIFYPFEYPREWIEQGIAWNEAYLLRAFLMNNDRYQVRLFNSFIGHDSALKQRWPDFTNGGSIYIQKVR